jgi:8-oxo-dGTP diphosphatase
VWDLPGGHVEEEESPTAALVRELREELGVEVVEPGSECHFHVAGDGFEMKVWRIGEWVGEPSNAAPAEHDDVRWFSERRLRTISLAHPDYPRLIATALRPTRQMTFTSVRRYPRF